jgi:hypothetical protein
MRIRRRCRDRGPGSPLSGDSGRSRRHGRGTSQPRGESGFKLLDIVHELLLYSCQKDPLPSEGDVENSFESQLVLEPLTCDSSSTSPYLLSYALQSKILCMTKPSIKICAIAAKTRIFFFQEASGTSHQMPSTPPF